MLHKDEKVGDYLLEKFLGRGQFGEVWLAEKQIQISRKKIRHALKFLLNTSGEEIDLQNAQEEIDTWIEAGGHPNVINVLDMLVHEGHVVIVSEFADGGSLKDWLKLHKGKAPTQEKAIELMLGIMRGIEHLHTRNVVHRDLKPENILLQGDFPRITDFGISRIVSENTSVTRAVGSPTYMSPEAFLGNKAPQTDIWSAGVILYELLSGNYPFKGDSIFLLKEAIDKDEPQPLPPDISDELKKIVEMALEKDRAKRLTSAHEMRLALEAASYNLRRSAYDETIADDQAHDKTIAGDKIDDKTTADEQANDKTIADDKIITGDKANDQTVADDKIIAPPELLKKTQMTETQPGDTAKDLNLKKQEEPGQTQAGTTQPTGEQKQIFDKTRMPDDFEQNQDLGQEIESLKIIQSNGKNGSSDGSNSKFIAAGIGVLILIALSIGGFFAFRSKEIVTGNTNSDSVNSNSSVSPPAVPAGMAYISGGEFMMGRDDGKSEQEKPAHKVLVNPFLMDTTEVSNEQYADFIKAQNHQAPNGWKNNSYPNGQANFPVAGVNWEDATTFCKNAQKRLPTEEEWEFAARGTNNLIYPWGNEWKKENANVEGKGFTEVGKFKSGTSPFGLYDMVGNASEWTTSDFKPYPNGKLPANYQGKENLKTVRGGSFEATEDYGTTTYRIGYEATVVKKGFYQQTGFRCAKNIEK